MNATGAKTKKAVIEAGLRELLQKQARDELIEMLGKTDLSISLKALHRQRKMENAKIRR